VSPAPQAPRLAGETNPSLGQTIRAARLGQRLGLRELARRVGLSAQYLVDIEHDRRVPAALLAESLSAALDLDVVVLLALAGRLHPDVADYLRRTPAAAQLLRVIAREELGAVDLAALTKTVERMAEAAGNAQDGEARYVARWGLPG
jgi:transcriptional regulator with XRE-family HTH domain